ncbi:MFS general substrate transporter [Apiospora arundinis]|uniref:MFS general substrate transporter n=1 Tax=Apiospora arundinis TaxID=335852 RepID=A0ABR2IW45_9PEZI
MEAQKAEPVSGPADFLATPEAKGNADSQGTEKSTPAVAATEPSQKGSNSKAIPEDTDESNTAESAIRRPRKSKSENDFSFGRISIVSFKDIGKMRESSCQTDPIAIPGEKNDGTVPQAAAAPAAIAASQVPRSSQTEERATSKGSSTLIGPPDDSKNHQVDVEKGTETPLVTNLEPTQKAPPSGPSGPPGPPGMDEDEAERNFQPKTLKFWAIMVSVFMAMFLVALDRTIIGTAIPKITDEFRSVGDIGWYGSAYQLTTAASQLLFGRIYRFYDIKWTFLISVFIFEAGSAICGAAPSSVVFIVGRAIAGLGGAGIFSGTMIIMIPMIPLRKRPMFQGVFGMVFGLASVMGPLVGGGFTDGVTWRWCFYINLPIGAAAVACLLLTLRLPHKKIAQPGVWEQVLRLDPLGTLFFVPSVVSLLLALQWGGSTYTWSNPRIIALLVVFGVLWLAFMAVQALKPKTATVPPRVIGNRSILAGAIFMLAIAGSMLMTIYFVPLWFQVVQGVSAVKSGIYTLPFVLSLVVASILSGAVTQRIGYYVPAMLVCPSLMATGEGLMSTFRVGEVASHWIGFQFIAGFGLGIGMQASSLAAQSVLPKPDVPTGISIMFFAQQLGGAIFTSVGQNLLSNSLVDQLRGIPGIQPGAVVGEGATDFVDHVPADLKDQVLHIYNNALTHIFRTAMGVALVAVVAAMFMEWKNLKKTGPPKGGPPAPAPAQAPAASAPVTAPSDSATTRASMDKSTPSSLLADDTPATKKSHDEPVSSSPPQATAAPTKQSQEAGEVQKG